MKRRRVVYGVGAMLCVALLVAMRSAASWRPHKVAFLGLQRGDRISAPRSRIAENGRVLLVECATRKSTTDAVVAWDTSTWEMKGQFPIIVWSPGAPARIVSFDVSPDGQEVAVIKSLQPQGPTQVASLGEISSLTGTTKRPLAPVRAKTSDFGGWDGRQAFTQFSPDGELVGIGSWQNIWFWNRKSGALVRQVALPTSKYKSKLVLSPDLKTAISSSREHLHSSGHILLWNIEAEPRLVAGSIEGTAPVFSSNGKRFVYRTDGNLTLVCVDTTTGKNVWTARLNTVGRDTTWSRDGSTVFALDESGISAFAAQSGAPLGSMPASKTIQILPSTVANEVWCLDRDAQLWSQRVY